MYCFGADDIGDIEMLGFSETDVDSTFLVFYKKGSDFVVVEDSLMLEILGHSTGDIFFGHSSRNISVDYDYRVYFTLIDREYTISGFKTSKAECNECFPRKDYYDKIEGYEINGKYKDLSGLQIDNLND